MLQVFGGLTEKKIDALLVFLIEVVVIRHWLWLLLLVHGNFGPEAALEVALGVMIGSTFARFFTSHASGYCKYF